MKLDITKIVKNQGYTITDLAKATNISRTTLNKYINQPETVLQMNLQYLEQLCTILGCTPNDILIPEKYFEQNSELRKEYLKAELNLLDLEEKSIIEKKQEIESQLKSLEG